LEAKLAELDALIAAGKDEYSREQYRQARAARESQLRVRQEMERCLQRVQAQMANVLSTLDAAEAQVMMLQAADLTHAGELGDSVTRSLQALGQEIASFQEGLDATMALRAR
ncbi:MAG: hypothetical protein QHJ73_19255, partial [Armatimonadota bacterium]|nr:hypothetical protein [Armatimonadota bacterium]